MKHLRRSLAFFTFVLLVLIGVALLAGCAHTEDGIKREEVALRAAKAALDPVARYIAPLVPAPYSGLVNLAVGAAGAALGAWSLSQEKRLKKLQAGKPTN